MGMPVDVEMIREMKQAMNCGDLLKFVPDDFSARAEAAYNTMSILHLDFQNVWDVYVELHSLVYPSTELVP